MPRFQSFVAFLIATVAPAVLAGLAFHDFAAANEPTGAQIEFFENKIRPVLVDQCYECHSGEAENLKGGLSLDTRKSTIDGGDSGAAIVPGDADESLLIQAIRYEGLEMPPGGKLTAQVVADFERWVKIGAPDPRTAAAAETPNDDLDIEAGKSFWAFQRPERHRQPMVERQQWPRRPIDWFILRRLEEAELAPAPEADRRTLIRRVSFDLTGLPPTPEQVEAFINDPSPRAYEKLVDRLLASPRYGERWARLWLDVSRYAEDQAHIVGSNSSLFYPNAYLYRDWVIDVLNDDLPYDEFVRLQLAADLVDPQDDANLAALGFIGLGPKYYRRRNLAVQADEWEDRVDTVARGLLGLTVACARCHDHKFDPIATEDYYALAGVFASTEMFNRPLQGRKAEKDGQAKAPKDAMHIIRDGELKDLSVFIRGDVTNKGPVVPRRFLEVLCRDEPVAFQTGSGRRELAEAIVSRDNPLTARVIVNRIWAMNVGRPLVGTPSNFGQLGERPTHPKLLDDLAVRFMDAGWSLKWLQREIVLSAAYRQDSLASQSQLAADPDNRLLGRAHRRRLDVESWRDALLAISGRMDGAIGGSSIDPQNPDQRRRTVYSRISRLDLNPLLAMFDFPDPNAHAASRTETITPLQKLFVLNSPFMAKQAEAFADRLLTEVSEEPNGAERRRVERAWQLVFGRPPTTEEAQLGLTFIRQTEEDPLSVWRQFAQVLLASNEASYID